MAVVFQNLGEIGYLHRRWQRTVSTVQSIPPKRLVQSHLRANSRQYCARPVTPMVGFCLRTMLHDAVPVVIYPMPLDLCCSILTGENQKLFGTRPVIV